MGLVLQGLLRIGPLQWGGVAFLLRLLCALISSPVPRDDGVYYVVAGRDLAHGMGYLLRGEPTAYWPVGYPFFLSLVFRVSGDSLVAAKVVQVFMSTAIVLMTYWLARRVYGREEPARLAAALLAVLPSQIAFPSLILSEVLFTALTLAGFASLTWSRSWPAATLGGLCFGLAVLVRPIALLLPLAGIWLIRPGRMQEKVRSLALVYAVLFCVTLPWAIRSSRVLRAPVWVSTNFGINFWMGNHEGATGRYRFTPEMERSAARIKDEAAFDSYARTQAVAFIREHPGKTLRLFLRKTILFWSPDMEGVKGVFPRDRSWQAKVFAGLHRLSYFGLWALLGAALWWRHPPSSAILLPLLYYTAVYAVIVAEPRYHVPATPWVVLGAAAAALPRDKQNC